MPLTRVIDASSHALGYVNANTFPVSGGTGAGGAGGSSLGLNGASGTDGSTGDVHL